jgi:hypothetical protein
LLDVVERVHVGNIVDDTNAVGAAVVGRGDGSETLLASSVPLYKFERLASTARFRPSWRSDRRSQPTI